MKDNKWPYLAGIMDGEGTISINQQGKSTNFPKIVLDITVVNTDERLMKWLIKYFGGRYRLRDRQDSPNHSLSFSWRVTGKANKEHILLGLLPYLVIKRAQAMLGLEFVRMELHERNPQKRYELAIKCRALNEKGPKAPETNTQNVQVFEKQSWPMIESVLIGDNKSDTVVTQLVTDTVSVTY